ncbi:MAG TPA: hypothetical protein VFE24_05570 [Pirellulales bacterium]|nr:hypothetical protein [Pirellulales bacterium]
MKRCRRQADRKANWNSSGTGRLAAAKNLAAAQALVAFGIDCRSNCRLGFVAGNFAAREGRKNRLKVAFSPHGGGEKAAPLSARLELPVVALRRGCYNGPVSYV